MILVACTKMPGSHVIIESLGEEIPATTLEEAASLAAYYSKGKNSNNVPVDYTERKNVKKPSNAKSRYGNIRKF